MRSSKKDPADDPRTLLVMVFGILARQRIDVATPLHSNLLPRTRENPFSAIEIANQFGGGGEMESNSGHSSEPPSTI